MITVKATREGLVGKRTASGYIVDKIVPYVALPSTGALGMHVLLVNERNGNQCIACVLDAGPWNEHDDDYVFNHARPAAERGVSVSGEGANRAGIDLGEAVWRLLAMTDNDSVSWLFIDPHELGKT